MRRQALLILVCVGFVGCGSGSPFDYVKTSGKVTYDDGSPIPAGRLELRFSALDAPQTAGAFPRPAIASVNENGEFDCVTSYKYGDGLIRGRHKVYVDISTGPNAKALVPKEYTSIATTPLEVDTKDAPFEIKVPKPKASR